MYHILLPIALLTGGLAAGALMVSALGGAPMLLSLPVASYVPVHKFLVTRLDPFTLSLRAILYLPAAATELCTKRRRNLARATVGGRFSPALFD